MRISFVIPVYNERETLEPLVEGIREHVAPHDHQILLVDDGSTDGSFEIMRELEERFDAVEVIRLRRNFGKSAALAVGFARVDGELVFTMDSDLQDDPKEIPRFIGQLGEEYDVVCGWKAVRHDPWHKTAPSRVYNAFVSWLFGLPVHDVNCGFKLLRREVAERVRVYGEMHRLIPVHAHALGFRVTEIDVEHHERRHGVSKFGFERFSRGALDVLTMWFLTRHRHHPGHLFGKVGIVEIGLGGLAFAAGLCGAHVCGGPAVLVLMGVVLATAGIAFCTRSVSPR